MLTLTYEYKLIPTAQQIEAIEHSLTVCRSVWNYALRERKDWLNSRKSPVNACSLEKEYIIPESRAFSQLLLPSQAINRSQESQSRP